MGAVTLWYFAIRPPSVSRRPLRIGFEPNPPMQIRTGNGYSGLAVEVVREAAKRAGVQLRWVETGTSSDEAFQKVVLQTWKSEGSESGIAPIMRRLESRIGPLRTEAVQQSPPWVATGLDLSESCAQFRFLELFAKPRRRIGILDWPGLAV